MHPSIIIRSRNEADRLRLTLTSFACQTEACEVVVVDDGSSDHTREVLAAAAGELNLKAIHHPESMGRSSSSNAGAAQATGDILIFMDGDTLAAPDLVAQHMALHRQAPNLIVRGESWHIRGTRFFLDPETGTPMPGKESQVQRMSARERERALVTRVEIRTNFDAIQAKGQPGIYPGFGPHRLYDLEMETLRQHPDSHILWATASGSNQSVPRKVFLEAGGFHPEISINEHRELALRLCQQGLRMATTPARSYHLTHRSGWRDPLQETDWERFFFAAHPLPEVALLPFFWASFSEAPPFPKEACIQSLPELAELAENYRGIKGLQNIRNAHLQASSLQQELQ